MPSAAAADPPVLWPVPRKVCWGSGRVSIAGDLPLVIDPGHRELLPSAWRFQRDVGRRTGVAVTLSASTAGLAGAPYARIVAGAGRIGHAQGYHLAVRPQEILVEADTAEGAAHGLATLKQLLLSGGRQLPEVEIADHPDFERRGVMLDVSRGKVPTMPELYRLVDLLADLKLNEFQLYTEHTFAYRGHREVWQNYSPVTGEEILSLDLYCRERFIDLVPNQNSFGHMTPWLVHPRYRHMAETLDGWVTPWGERREEPFTLCPLEPSVIPFLAGLYDELLPHFSSRYFNVGCDETFDLGQGRSREAVARSGEHRVYLDQLLKIHELVRARGKTMQFWGDIVIKAPEHIAELPKDLVALEWGYEANHPFDQHGAHYARSGLAFYVCPGTSTWNSVVGRTDNALGNMRNAAENGRKHGARGYLNTIWGDRGHQDYQPVWYLGIAFGAASSWALDANRDVDVRPFLDRFVFEDPSERIGAILHDLGNVYHAVGVEPHNASALGVLLQRGIHGSGPWLEGSTAEGFDRAAARVSEIAAGLGHVRLRCEDAALVHAELRNAVRMLLHACELGKLRLDVLSGKPPATARVLGAIEDLDEIMAEHRSLWLARNRIGGLEEMSLAPFRRLREEYAALL